MMKTAGLAEVFMPCTLAISDRQFAMAWERQAAILVDADNTQGLNAPSTPLGIGSITPISDAVSFQ